jgi:hypothetical protein
VLASKHMISCVRDWAQSPNLDGASCNICTPACNQGMPALVGGTLYMTKQCGAYKVQTAQAHQGSLVVGMVGAGLGRIRECVLPRDLARGSRT